MNYKSYCNFHYHKILLHESKNIRESVANSDDYHKISKKYIGNFFHEGMETLLQETKKNLMCGDFKISAEQIESVFFKILERDSGKKIPNFCKAYYTRILIPKFKDNILIFYHETLATILSTKKITEIQIETMITPERNFYQFEDIEVQLTGKLDLLITCADHSTMLYDHKTGKKTAGQLEYYSVALYRDVNASSKFVFNSWDGKTEEIKTTQNNGKPTKFANLKEVLFEDWKSFLEGETIPMAGQNKNGIYVSCLVCPYQKLCKRG
jgi:hypothetical protein